MEKNRVFGTKCLESFASYDRESSSWKTFQLSLFGGLAPFLETFPQSGMMRNGVLYRLRTLEPCTCEDAGSVWRINPACQTTDGLLPTPTKLHSERKKPHAQGGRPLLFQLLKANGEPVFLPTPTTSEQKYRLQGDSQASKCLEAKARRGELCSITGIKKPVLNPSFVEWMMGFPIGYLN